MEPNQLLLKGTWSTVWNPQPEARNAEACALNLQKSRCAAQRPPQSLGGSGGVRGWAERRARGEAVALPRCVLISQSVFITLLCKSRFLHKSVHLYFLITNIKKKLTDWCENRLLQNDFINTFSQTRLREELPEAPEARAYGFRVSGFGCRV